MIVKEKCILPFLDSDQSQAGAYEYFLDQDAVAHHRLLIFGLRELNVGEVGDFCSYASGTSLPNPRTASHFTTDYYLRLYTSACYSLDDKRAWQSDGLRVCAWNVTVMRIAGHFSFSRLDL